MDQNTTYEALTHEWTRMDTNASQFVQVQVVDLVKGCDIIRLMETATNYRYIVKTEGVRSGNARIEDTRIGVHDVVAYFLLGRDVDGIRAAFPDLTRITRTIKLKSSDWPFLRSKKPRSEIFPRPRRARRG